MVDVLLVVATAAVPGAALALVVAAAAPAILALPVVVVIAAPVLALLLCGIATPLEWKTTFLFTFRQIRFWCMKGAYCFF